MGPTPATLASPGSLLELQTLGPTPHLLNKNSGSEVAHAVFTSSPGDSDVCEGQRTTDF